jgi:NAD(P)-dependent dehydrogenase (short-subunit alcohol dehydrogenase family)
MHASTGLAYEAKRVVVAGGGGTGMGAATASLLQGLGAEVTVFDLQPPPGDHIAYLKVDLGDPADIDRAVEQVGTPVDALFNCQGISGVGTRSADVMRVNFLGVRHLSEALIPMMGPGGGVVSISSTGGLGWQRRMEPISELLAIEDFDAAVRWVESQTSGLLAHAFPNAYAFSKQALIAWTMRRAATAITRGVRVNCSSPGSTRTTMAADFPSEGVELVNLPSGRDSTPQEQAWPIVFLNSEGASYVNGVNLVVDGGHAAARAMGMLEASR